MKLAGWALIFALGVTVGIISMTRRGASERASGVEASPDGIRADELLETGQRGPNAGTGGAGGEGAATVEGASTRRGAEPEQQVSDRGAQIQHFLDTVERLEGGQ